MLDFRSRHTAIMLSGFIIAVSAIYLWWSDRQLYEATDNAFVETDIISLSPRVSGYVLHLLVRPNDLVIAGQPLAEIDQSEFKFRLTSAEAKRDEMQAALSAIKHRGGERLALQAEQQAEVASAAAILAAAESDRRRINDLSVHGWATKRALQTATAVADEAAAGVAKSQAALNAEIARQRSLKSETLELRSRLKAAEAELGNAKLAMRHTVLLAPTKGTIGRILTHVGQYVRPGDLVMHIVPTRQRYLIANFKENQIARLRQGQSVDIELDAFSSRSFTGKIDSLSPATGAQFAALPIDNANGNFVKITQRIPVRISVPVGPETDNVFRPGLSASVRVYVGREH